jgi:hypothetical protein
MQEEKALRDPHYWETRDSVVSTECNNNNNTKCKKKKSSTRSTHYMHAPVSTALISYHSNTPAAAAAARRSVSFHDHHLHQCSNGALYRTPPLARAQSKTARPSTSGASWLPEKRAETERDDDGTGPPETTYGTPGLSM